MANVRCAAFALFVALRAFAWPCPRRIPALLAHLLVAALARPVLAQTSSAIDDERREAACIDYYNDPQHVDGDELTFRRNSALVRFFVEGVGAGATGQPTLTTQDVGYGARLNVDLPVISLINAASTDTGLSIGVSGSTAIIPDRSRSYMGELRLGIARRRYGVTWSNVSKRCLRERVDLGIDLLRWRVGAFTDLKTAGEPTTFVSGVGFPGLVARLMYPTWGIGGSVSFPDFRLTPSVQWGASGSLELYYGFLAMSATATVEFLPQLGFSLALGVGGKFEVGGRS